MFKKISYTLIGLLLCAPLAQASSAVFTTYPSHTLNNNKWIIRDVNPGQSYQEEITAENLQNYPITLTLQVIESSGSKENIRLLENQPNQNIGNWIQPEINSIDLAAHQKQNIKINIIIPNKTELGEYQAVILTTNTDKNKGNLNIATRIGNRIYLNVTNNPILQTNIFSTNISVIQITFITLSVIAILYGIRPNKRPADQKQII